MAILLERIPFHVGYHHAKASYPDGDITSVHLGWLSLTHFHGSLVDMLERWQRTADDAVAEAAERMIRAELIGSDEEDE
jgi:hypothetical protein